MALHHSNIYHRNRVNHRLSNASRLCAGRTANRATKLNVTVVMVLMDWLMKEQSVHGCNLQTTKGAAWRANACQATLKSHWGIAITLRTNAIVASRYVTAVSDHC